MQNCLVPDSVLNIEFPDYLTTFSYRRSFFKSIPFEHLVVNNGPYLSLNSVSNGPYLSLSVNALISLSYTKCILKYGMLCQGIDGCLD